jgi:anti-sigma regulatory factor (Ser/Thr protein kinase)
MVIETRERKIKFDISFFSEYEKTIEEKFDDFVNELDLSKEEKKSILTVTMELALNAEEHSKTPDHKATISFFFRDTSFMVGVEDSGIGWTNESKNKDAFRGNGLKMVRALMDSILVSDYKKGLTVTAIKEVKRGLR